MAVLWLLGKVWVRVKLTAFFYRRFNADGSARDAADRLANNFERGIETTPAVAINDAGDFAIAWEVGNQIFVRPFGDDGSPLRVEDWVNVASISAAPDVVIDATGRITVVWRSNNLTHDGIWMRTYASDGTPGVLCRLIRIPPRTVPTHQLPWIRRVTTSSYTKDPGMEMVWGSLPANTTPVV